MSGMSSPRCDGAAADWSPQEKKATEHLSSRQSELPAMSVRFWAKLSSSVSRQSGVRETTPMHAERDVRAFKLQNAILDAEKKDRGKAHDDERKREASLQ
ncbi:hypothetical protein BESB_016830 [Besnoitia besnoiti]|uniref:Uncharacterized protein n=1 Tax=Besnoitia besnoiti TaxID=94643 RepID=A0A2A9M332_BESBE|nr:hypothetical protein BESB_016830 [Besnoitia besnoiti]PFH32365.1 hypothetical protein BESB_016830 [Besnoitia besnoiti]